MSHQTGIRASEELKELFSQAKDGSFRLIKVIIANEALEVGDVVSAVGAWDEDWDSALQNKLEEKSPCYILYRLDSKNNIGYEWVFISFSPDFSPVRDKMIYAGTRSTLKQEFGSGLIKDELFGTAPVDICLAGYKKHLTAKDAPAPLTFAEEELDFIKKNETNADIHVDSKHQTLTGVSFPVTQDAHVALENLRDGTYDYVQLSLNVEREEIELEERSTIDTSTLASRIPNDKPRYHFFRFKHTFEGDYLKDIVFIYSMPGYMCSVKERMLYSSGKGPLLEVVEGLLKIEIVRKIEIDDPREVTEEFLYDEVHPKKDIVRKKFDRPKPPGRTGGRRPVNLQ